MRGVARRGPQVPDDPFERLGNYEVRRRDERRRRLEKMYQSQVAHRSSIFMHPFPAPRSRPSSSLFLTCGMNGSNHFLGSLIIETVNSNQMDRKA
jgi:hypothetical protein